MNIFQKQKIHICSQIVSRIHLNKEYGTFSSLFRPKKSTGELKKVSILNLLYFNILILLSEADLKVS